jgi:ribosome biogenesis GTPase
MQEITKTGLIVRAQSGFFTVKTEAVLVTCQLRGRLKQGRHLGDIAAIGDRVTITLTTNDTGMIESIEDRQHALIRLDPRPRGVYQQVILANLDQVVFVFACAQPSPRMRMLDRFLVIAEKQRIPAVIVANKIDLMEQTEAENLFGHYPALGYPVIYTSARQNLGVDALRTQLTGKISALAGPSGVGKSSLLNAVQSGLGLIVREISGAMNKGRHTTNFRQLLPLQAGGYVGDTPGLKSLALWDTEPEELDGYFPEIAPLVSQCKYNNCTHKPNEVDCAVRNAVDAGSIHPERYESYVRLRAGEE